MIFVFGSNLGGRHGAGAARDAHQLYGAEYGTGVGRTGNCYAIPTKDRKIHTLAVYVIKPYIDDFIQYAKDHPELTFKVTRIGCGLAGYKDSTIAPLFKEAPQNCQFDANWKFWLPNYTYWGTM